MPRGETHWGNVITKIDDNEHLAVTSALAIYPGLRYWSLRF